MFYVDYVYMNHFADSTLVLRLLCASINMKVYKK